MIQSYLHGNTKTKDLKNAPPNRQISMMEHIFLSFSPYCGIFISTQRESSAREISQPAPSKHG
jgi:hypothetical protein